MKYLKGVLSLISYIVSKTIKMNSNAKENLVFMIETEKIEEVLLIYSVCKKIIDFLFDQTES